MRERTQFPASLVRAAAEARTARHHGLKNAAIDMDAAKAHGVTVCGTASSGNAVPEITLGMIIALSRHFVAEATGSAVGRLAAHDRSGTGRHDAGCRRARAARHSCGETRPGVRDAGHRLVAEPHRDRAAEHGVRAASKDELFADSDVITIHMPLSDRSRGLIGADDLARMKPTAYLVNTSRGPIVDEAALVAALAGAAHRRRRPRRVRHRAAAGRAPVPVVAERARAAAHRLRHDRPVPHLVRASRRRHRRVG